MCNGIDEGDSWKYLATILDLLMKTLNNKLYFLIKGDIQFKELGGPSSYLQGSLNTSTHILIGPSFYQDSISKLVILKEDDQDECVGSFSIDIKIGSTPFLDIIVNEREEDEQWGYPLLYIETRSHFPKDTILEVLGQDERLGDIFSYIVIVSHYVT